MNEVIEDFHMEWHPETGMVHVFVTKPDGSEEEVWSVQPSEAPAWANGDKRDYEDWYNDVLQDLHKHGYVLSGEKE